MHLEVNGRKRIHIILGLHGATVDFNMTDGRMMLGASSFVPAG